VSNARLGAVIATAALAAAAAGTAVAVTAGHSPQASSPGSGAQVTAGANRSSYSYYQSMMGGSHGGSMMGGSPDGWRTGWAGYRWMMGGADAPGWMRGGALPGFMMGTSDDPGAIMGALWADAPGSRVSRAQTARLGSQVPAGATVDRAQHRVTFHSSQVTLAVVAGAPGSGRYSFDIASMANPAIAVPLGAHVSIEVINADPGMAHGLVITARPGTRSWMPMMTAAPAFPGSAAWFLGSPTTAGMHATTLTFSATAPGTYQYLCAVPGHAQRGMAGSFTVSNAKR